MLHQHNVDIRAIEGVHHRQHLAARHAESKTAASLGQAGGDHLDGGRPFQTGSLA
jgi:hypothetical protein